MKWLSRLPVLLLILSSTAWAENPEHDLPGQAESPVQEPSHDSILPNVGEVPDVADLSPGDHAPDFKLHSSGGRLMQLSDLKGRLSVLIFGTDCALLGGFAADHDSLAALGVAQIGICPNSTRAIEAYASRKELPFPLLSDPNGVVSQRFGMYDADNQIIQPGLVMLDARGIVLMIVQGAGLHPDAVPVLVRHAIAAHLARASGA